MYVPVRRLQDDKVGKYWYSVIFKGTKFFLMLRWYFSYLICIHLLLPCHWAPPRVWLDLCFATSEGVVCSAKTPLSLLFSGWNSPSTLSLSFYDLCVPLIHYGLFTHVRREFRPAQSSPVMSQQGWVEGQNHIFW